MGKEVTAYLAFIVKLLTSIHVTDMPLSQLHLTTSIKRYPQKVPEPPQPRAGGRPWPPWSSAHLPLASSAWPCSPEISSTPHSCSFLPRAGSEQLPRAQPTWKILRDGRHRCFQPLPFGSGAQLGMVLPLGVTFERGRTRFCLSRWRVGGVLVSWVGRAREAAILRAGHRIAGLETSEMLRSRNFVLHDHRRFLLNASWS